VLKDSIATDCRIESVSVNVNRFQNYQGENFNIAMNAAFRITLK
jgi:hypothetical protein